MNDVIRIAVILLALTVPVSASGVEPIGIVVENAMVHIRSTDTQEWASFPETPAAQDLKRRFGSAANSDEWTLSLRQQDVKQAWDIKLNDRSIGRLVRDENDIQADFAIPAGWLVDGENRLDIRQAGKEPDDIRVGQIELHSVAADRLRNLATIEVSVRDATGTPLPGRITVLNDQGTRIPVGATSGSGLAVRQGVVYTVSGKAAFGVAPGQYRLVAGRGFEYSVDETRVDLAAGQRVARTMTLSREVDTEGWVACDTHVHTVTHSGHGDCTIDERMVTLAGEGIELPIATDHNKAIDYRPIADAIGAAAHFTPVIGDELTTKKGHFNLFPIQPGGRLPDHRELDWGRLFDDVESTPDVRIAILNHAQDIHSGFRPFSPVHHLSLTGENLDGRPQRFNAMEVVNSGAVQTDLMQLYRDWCGLINRGLIITPVGSSDSHDVARFIVGQGRTYIRCDDRRVDSINVSDALDAFVNGRVIVSYGLLTKLTVNPAFEPGDLATFRNDRADLLVTVEVLGPAWSDADSVALYVCGKEKFRQAIGPTLKSETGLKTSVTWRIPRSEFSHDFWLSAVAVGPGIEHAFWKTALPYQPTSSSFSPYVFSSTGPIRVDGDGDGKFTSPLEYAKQIFAKCDGDAESLPDELTGHAPCIALSSIIHQVASLLRHSEGDLADAEATADGEVAKAIAEYRRAWNQCVVGKLEGSE